MPAAAQTPESDSVRVLDRMVVTGGRLATSADNLPRNLTVIDREDIESTPVQSVAELLEYAVGLDVRQRGPSGVQSDVGIQGGSFEQTLVLVDGVRMSDPQTGHHAMDLTLAVDDIERIEVLRGHGSRAFGPNAFAGVINIITRNAGGRHATLGASGGEFGYMSGTASVELPLGPTHHRVCVQKSSAQGYRHNTDFDNAAVSYASSYQFNSSDFSVHAGFADKDFGANGFYSEFYPDQREHTRTATASLTSRLERGRLTVVPKASWRYHDDDFTLDRKDPDWFRNHHATHATGIECQADVRWVLGTSALGGEVRNETIASTNLGDHDRLTGGLFFEHHTEILKRIVLVPGAYVYRYDRWGWKLWPGLDLGVRLTPSLNVHGSVGYSFRIPSFTELYYASPTNVGNSGLEPEKALTYEIGVRAEKRPVSATIGAFSRRGENLIDWIRQSGAAQWSAANITDINAYGVDADLRLDPRHLWDRIPVTSVSMGYSYLHMDKEASGFESKYVLDYLKHKAVLGVGHRLVWALSQQWYVRMERRNGDRRRYYIFDTWTTLEQGPVSLYLSVANLTNTPYADITSAPMPGRWMRAGLQIALKQEIGSSIFPPKESP